jgi:hypothetical protein
MTLKQAMTRQHLQSTSTTSCSCHHLTSWPQLQQQLQGQQLLQTQLSLLQAQLSLLQAELSLLQGRAQFRMPPTKPAQSMCQSPMQQVQAVLWPHPGLQSQLALPYVMHCKSGTQP